MTMMVRAIVLCAILPAVAFGQIASVGSMLPDKAQLLDQAGDFVTDLTSMKSSGKLGAADTAKVKSLLPKATALNDELAKPQVSQAG